MEHPSVPGEGFQGNLLEQAQPVEGGIHSSPILHTGADGLCRDVTGAAGAVWPLQAGGNGRSLRKGCSALPITPQGWKSPWPGPGSASHGDSEQVLPSLLCHTRFGPESPPAPLLLVQHLQEKALCYNHKCYYNKYAKAKMLEVSFVLP